MHTCENGCLRSPVALLINDQRKEMRGCPHRSTKATRHSTLKQTAAKLLSFRFSWSESEAKLASFMYVILTSCQSGTALCFIICSAIVPGWTCMAPTLAYPCKLVAQKRTQLSCESVCSHTQVPMQSIQIGPDCL